MALEESRCLHKPDRTFLRLPPTGSFTMPSEERALGPGEATPPARRPWEVRSASEPSRSRGLGLAGIQLAFGRGPSPQSASPSGSKDVSSFFRAPYRPGAWLCPSTWGRPCGCAPRGPAPVGPPVLKLSLTSRTWVFQYVRGLLRRLGGRHALHVTSGTVLWPGWCSRAIQLPCFLSPGCRPLGAW